MIIHVISFAQSQHLQSFCVARFLIMFCLLEFGSFVSGLGTLPLVYILFITHFAMFCEGQHTLYQCNTFFYD
jgi:hypothetical protein